MTQKNGNEITKVLVVVIITLIATTLFSGGFYIFTTQNKIVKFEKEKEKTSQNQTVPSNKTAVQTTEKIKVVKTEKTSLKTTNEKKQNIQKISYEKQMIARMEPIENELDYYTLDNTNSCADYVSYRATLHEKWDNELTKIYKMLMSRYSESQKKALKREEIAWIKERQKVNDQIASEMGGCMGAAVTIENTEIETIKARAIELAKRYDKLN